MASALALKLTTADYGSILELDRDAPGLGPFTPGADVTNDDPTPDRRGPAGIVYGGMYVRATETNPLPGVHHNLRSHVVGYLWHKYGGTRITGEDSDPLCRLVEVSIDTDDIVLLPNGARGFQDIAPSSVSVCVSSLHVEREIEVGVDLSGSTPRAYLIDLGSIDDYTLP